MLCLVMLCKGGLSYASVCIAVAAKTSVARSAGRWQPEETASLTSWLLFKYAVGIMKLGSQKYLVQEDLWAVSR